MPRSAPLPPSQFLARSPKRLFARGYTAIIRPGSRGHDPAATGLEFGILRLGRAEHLREKTRAETVLLLLDGSVTFLAGGANFTAERTSLFDGGPSTFHCGSGETIEVIAGPRGAELACIRAPNSTRLPVRFTPQHVVASEDRGAGLVQGACRRCVRTVFDHSSRPESQVVVGEVVNYPGRWSSYPPHHHPQPEIYHYRFTEPQGYGHAELGHHVLRVGSGDTVSIPAGLDHAQVSAPGYGMYYLWIVRHLPHRPYKGFTFTPAHTWLLDPKRQGWQPPIGITP